MRLRIHSILTIIALGSLVATGCTAPSTESDRGASSTAQDTSGAQLTLAPGTKLAEVEAQLGKPVRTSQVQDNGNTIDVRVYERLVGTRMDNIALNMAQTPWFDPITGEYRPLSEPVTTTQQVDLIEEIVVFFMGDAVVGSRRTVSERRGLVQ
jgi:hypothetical protein